MSAMIRMASVGLERGISLVIGDKGRPNIPPQNPLT